MESFTGPRTELPAFSAPKPPLLTVTVVVCTRNRPGELATCLDAISKLNPQPDDVLVIDNSEGDPATERVARERGVRYLLERASGLSRARNRGLAESTSEIVAYIDDDAVPCEDWLEHILAPFADPEMAMVSGEVEPEGVVRDRTAPVRSLCAKDLQWFEIAAFGGLGMGTGMAVRKAAGAIWTGFDARLGRGASIRIAEESHAATTLLALGYRAAVAPAAIVAASFETLRSPAPRAGRGVLIRLLAAPALRVSRPST